MVRKKALPADMDVFGIRARKELERMGIKDKTFAEMLEVTPITVYNYLSGRRTPDMSTLKVMANTFGCSIDYLVGRSDVRNPAEPDIPIDDEIAKKELQKLAKALNEAEKQKYITPAEKIEILKDANTIVDMRVFKFKNQQ